MAYTPHDWQTGEVITEELLDHMEQGIESGNDNMLVTITITPTDDSATATCDTAITDIINALESGNTVNFRYSLSDNESVFYPIYLISYENNESLETIIIELGTLGTYADMGDYYNFSYLLATMIKESNNADTISTNPVEHMFTKYTSGS